MPLRASSVPSEERLPPAHVRKRVSKACDKCRSLKAKCNGKKPSCARCLAYDYDCSYGGKGRSKSLSLASSEMHLREVVTDYEELLRSLLPKLSEEDRMSVSARLNAWNGTERKSTGILSPSLNSTRTPENLDIDSPSSGSASEGFLGVGSDIHFLRKSLQRLEVGEYSNPERSRPVLNYNLDDADRMPRSNVAPHHVPKARAISYMKVYFSTVHVAYPFLSHETFETLLPQLWEDGAVQTLNDSCKATFYMIFAWSAVYMSLSEEQTGVAKNEHLTYYKQARLYLGDIIDTFPVGLDLISCLVLVSLYLLMTHKPYRCANMLGITIRMAQGIGLHAAHEEGDLTQYDKERRRRIWYCLYIMDRLVALQLGGAVMIRDSDFSVDLPSEPVQFDQVSNLAPSDVSYLRHMVGLSKIIGDVIDHLYRSGQAVIRLEQLLETIHLLDNQVLAWRDQLPLHLRFDHAHPFEANAIFKRQRNFLGIKFHHLRTLIHRPCLCLESLHHSELAAAISGWTVDWDHNYFQCAEATCIAESRLTIQMLDRVVDKRDLLWEFPWWQMISCLMCAMSVIVIATIVYPEHPDSVGLRADIETCCKVLEALSTHSASAERCVKMIEVMRGMSLRKKGQVNPSSTPDMFTNEPLFFQSLVDGMGSLQDSQADVIESMYDGWFPDKSYDVYISNPLDIGTQFNPNAERVQERNHPAEDRSQGIG